MATLDDLNLEFAGQTKMGSEDTHPKAIKYEGLVTDLSGRRVIGSPSIIMKLYQMYTAGGSPIEPGVISRGEDFLRDEIRKPGFTANSGLGFTIVSAGGDMVNAVLWSHDFPTVPVNSLWLYDSKQGRFNRMDINVEGSFCRGERRVLNAEALAWDAYLASGRTEEAKRGYLKFQVPDGAL